MKTRNTLLGMFVIAFAMCSVMVSAYDADTPYTVTMQWIVPSDTSFTVSLAGAETTIDFDDNVVDKDSKYVQPDSQDNSTSTPIAEITNTGNQNLDFSCNLTATKPSWAVLMVNNATDLATATTFDTTAVTIQDNVAAAATVDMYLWTNLTNADAGTTSRTFQINSVASS